MDDWRSELVRTFPHLFFKIVDGELQLTASPHVGEGWRDTLERAMRRLDGVVREVEGSFIEVRQIKEKFGGLRIYLQTKGLDAHRERIDEIVFLAERRAAGACEICGAKGRLWSGDGWTFTACDQHAKGRPLGPDDPDAVIVDRSWSDGRVIERTLRYDRERDLLVEVGATVLVTDEK